MGAFAALGCDQGKQHDQPKTSGPPLAFLGASAGDKKPVPTDGVVELAFDRLLHPATTIRQAVPVRDASGNTFYSPVVTYDPIARVIRLEPDRDQVTGEPQEWLQDNQFYTITLTIPPEGDFSNGLRAIDGATIDPSLPVSTRTIAFFACSRDPAKTSCKGAGDPTQSQPAPAPSMNFCNDVQPIFLRHCASASCHNAPGAFQPSAGLVLEMAEGIRQTARGRVAQGSNTGPTSRVQAPGPHFGVNMAIIDPNHPGTSWMLYKLLLAPPPLDDAGDNPGRRICFSDGGVVPPTDVTPAIHAVATQRLSEAERAILRDYILGREMPFPDDPSAPPGTPTGEPPNPPLTIDELQRLRLWIEQGAPTGPNCIPCARPDDAGAP